MAHPNAIDHAARIAALEGVDDGLLRLAAGEWMCSRTSKTLLRHYGEAHFARATISRMFYHDPAKAKQTLRTLAPGAADDVGFLLRIMIDYGKCLVAGARTFINCDFLIIGSGPVVIGVDCLIGPRCGIYTPNHAEEPVARRDGRERTAPVPLEARAILPAGVCMFFRRSTGMSSEDIDARRKLSLGVVEVPG